MKKIKDKQKLGIINGKLKPVIKKLPHELIYESELLGGIYSMPSMDEIIDKINEIIEVLNEKR